MKPLWVSLFFICIVSFFGLFGVQAAWRKAISSQWEADHSLARTMMDFRDKMNAIESSNSRMEKIRAAIAAAPLAVIFNPGLITTLKAALQVEALMQKERVVSWKMKQGWGLITHSTLPDLPWSIDPPDLIGERPLRWIGASEYFLGGRQVKQRRSEVYVYRKQDSLWHARFGSRPNTI
ncbi:MAG: hypothetical protein KA715_13350 [Xanthomonadaceae bacterium]|nr:hypothetical protein [Xanthomonadaceae bacterium]